MRRACSIGSRAHRRREKSCNDSGVRRHHCRCRCGRLRIGQAPFRRDPQHACCCWRPDATRRPAASPLTCSIPIRDLITTTLISGPTSKCIGGARTISPPVGFSQGRVLGGGSTVMGMVAHRGTPDDYAEWEALGASGWGWDSVLPYYCKLENDWDFDGTLHGNDGPVPIRRTKADDWAPLAKAVHVFAQERQIPFIADMNGDFRDGYGAVPMSNWPLRRASAAICYLDAAARRR